MSSWQFWLLMFSLWFNALPAWPMDEIQPLGVVCLFLGIAGSFVMLIVSVLCL